LKRRQAPRIRWCVVALKKNTEHSSKCTGVRPCAYVFLVVFCCERACFESCRRVFRNCREGAHPKNAEVWARRSTGRSVLSANNRLVSFFPSTRHTHLQDPCHVTSKRATKNINISCRSCTADLLVWSFDVRAFHSDSSSCAIVSFGLVVAFRHTDLERVLATTPELHSGAARETQPGERAIDLLDARNCLLCTNMQNAHGLIPDSRCWRKEYFEVAEKRG